jgi:hypothetical protein
MSDLDESQTTRSFSRLGIGVRVKTFKLHELERTDLSGHPHHSEEHPRIKGRRIEITMKLQETAAADLTSRSAVF